MTYLHAFGLILRVDASTAPLALPTKNILTGTTLDSVCIAMADPLDDDTELQTSFDISPEGNACLCISGVGKFHISRHRITIYPSKESTPQALTIFLLGSAIGALLHLRGVLVLHGSTLQMPDGNAAIFCGHSGAGKSTLITALAQKGYACLADDVTAISFDERGQAWAQPGLPRVKLWEDSLTQLNISSNAEIWPGMNKYYVDLQVCEQAIPLANLYEIEASLGGSALSFQNIDGLRRISTLVTHTYRPSFVATLNQTAHHMAQVSKLAPQLRMTKILRPGNRNTLDEIVRCIDESWKQR